MRLGGLRNTADVTTDDAQVEHDRQVRQARLDLARRQSTWTEIPETRPVRRGPFLVDAETDLVYVRRRGIVFEPGRANIGYLRDNTTLAYYVDQNDDLELLEQHNGMRTWSEHVERRARRGKT